MADAADTKKEKAPPARSRSGAATKDPDTGTGTPKTGEADSEARRGIELPADGTELELDERSIHQRMIAVLAELPAIGKDSENTQQHFMYRSHDDVLNALNPLLAKHGIYLVPQVLERTTAERKTSGGKAMYEVNLHVAYRFYGAGGDYIQSSAWGEGTDMGDKSTNKAMTMAFKNVLAQAFAVSTQEAQRYDADGGTPEDTMGRGDGPDAPPDQPPPPPQEPLEDRMRKRIHGLTDALDVMTKAESGTWLDRTRAGVIVGWGYEMEPGGTADPLLNLDEAGLAEVGQVLKALIENGVTEVPEQIDFTVPF